MIWKRIRAGVYESFGYNLLSHGRMQPPVRFRIQRVCSGGQHHHWHLHCCKTGIEYDNLTTLVEAQDLAERALAWERLPAVDAFLASAGGPMPKRMKMAEFKTLLRRLGLKVEWREGGQHGRVMPADADEHTEIDVGVVRDGDAVRCYMPQE